MGWFHEYYVEACIREGICKYLVLELDDHVIGGITYYSLEEYVVIYYVVVDEDHRRRSYGRVLVSSVEELYGDNHVFIATTSSDNHGALKLFDSLNYKPLYEEEVLNEFGAKTLDLVLKLTCGYEDDVFMIKSSKGYRVLEELDRYEEEIVELWYRICYKPWRNLFT